MQILIVGGAGYIGSHMVKRLRNLGYEPVVLDNLSTGHDDAVGDAKLLIGDIRDPNSVDGLLQTGQFDAVMHFAACSQVAESVTDPGLYYENNVTGTINLLNSMRKHNVRHFIFSSTAAVYGLPGNALIDEQTPTNPINPYGQSKLMVEQILADMSRAYGIRYTALRYFNAAGADPEGQIGERHEPETHLIPLVLRVASGRMPAIKVFGRDYDTEDGTCIRDYIHVNDLCRAHEMALQRLRDGGESVIFNLGNGQGFSVQQVIDAARRVTGRSIPCVTADRRLGDPDRLVADSRLAQEILGWHPELGDLDTIIAHAWQWEQKLADSSKLALGAPAHGSLVTDMLREAG